MTPLCLGDLLPIAAREEAMDEYIEDDDDREDIRSVASWRRRAARGTWCEIKLLLSTGYQRVAMEYQPAPCRGL